MTGIFSVGRNIVNLKELHLISFHRHVSVVWQ